jgi:hypothetical protein
MLQSERLTRSSAKETNKKINYHMAAKGINNDDKEISNSNVDFDLSDRNSVGDSKGGSR